MKHLHLVAAIAPAFLASSAAHAALLFTSGTQTFSATVGAISGGGDNETEDSYDLTAPMATASWSPPDQSITASVSLGTYAEVHSSYSSIVEPAQISFELECSAEAVGPFDDFSSFAYDNIFSISFHLDAPTDVAYSASVQRSYISGWPADKPAFIEFGPDGGPALVSLESGYPGFPFETYYVDHPLTLMTLPAGDYHITAFSNNAWIAGQPGAFADHLVFDLIVPVPGALPAFAAFAMFTTVRRRPCNGHAHSHPMD
jgi:hypothetical protein